VWRAGFGRGFGPVLRQTARWWWWWWWYKGVSKIFRTDAVKIINLATKRVWNLPTLTSLRASWHIDSLHMVDLPSTGASRYHDCCIDGETSPEYFGYTSYDALCLCRDGIVAISVESVSSQNTACTQFLLRQVGRILPHQLQPRWLLHPTAGYCTYTGGSLPAKCRDDMRHFPGIRGRTKDLGGSSNAVGGTSVWTAQYRYRLCLAGLLLEVVYPEQHPRRGLVSTGVPPYQWVMRS
jgi:hypothetical protein